MNNHFQKKYQQIMSPKAYSYLRFSTPEQMKGDSFRRQIEAAVQFAKLHGLELDDTISFQDLGVSAYYGDNIQEGGALGSFLQAVDEGRIKAGSYLLVESLDRLSRQDVWSAFTQFSRIIQQGINIVTLQDGNTYSNEQGEIGFSGLITSIVTMQRAHEESLTKSKRLAAAWKAKRERAQDGKHKLTSWCPGWLELSEDRTHFRILEDRAKIIRRIFLETLDGKGIGTIANQFNAEGIPTFNRNRKSNGWHPSYVQKILANESTIGIFQPHKRVRKDGGKYKRVPDGDPVEGYYPMVIEPELFYKVKQVRSQRLIPMRNEGKRMSNLFSGLVYCGSCGAVMHYVNKGKDKVQRNYLVCSDARRKLGCHRHAWRYTETQCHIIMNLLDIDYRELFPKVYKQLSGGLGRLEMAVLKREGELQRTDEQIERVTDLLLERESSKALLGKLDTLEEQKETITKELEDLQKQVEQERERSASIGNDFQNVEQAMAETIRIEREGTPEEVLEIRRKLHQLLKKVIDRIVFEPTPNATHKGFPLHGKIHISFKDALDYKRVIYVRGGLRKPEFQKESWGYMVEDDKEPDFHVGVADAQWPPVDRIVCGAALWDVIKGGGA